MAQPPTRHKVTGRFPTKYLGAFIAGVCLALMFAFAVSKIADAQHSDERSNAYKTLTRQALATNDANCKNAGTKCIGDSKQVVKSLPTAVQSLVAQATAVPTISPLPPIPGRGITATNIVKGDLFVYYSDKTHTDAGPVVGKDGQPGKNGATGPAGRGVKSTSIDTGALMVDFTDGTRKNLGQVVGKAGAAGLNGASGTPGRGVASISIVAGHLIIAYTDQTADDLGPVVGKDGSDGDSITDVMVDDAGHLIVTITSGADGSTRAIDASYVMGPSGPAGKDAPTIVGHSITVDSDGNCVDTLSLSDGTQKPSNPYVCQAAPATTAPTQTTEQPSTLPSTTTSSESP